MIGYEELYEKYQRLLDENKLLRNEIESYKEQLGSVLPKFSDVAQHKDEADNLFSEELYPFGQVTNASPPQDKINLFMSLFRGREDVFA